MKLHHELITTIGFLAKKEDSIGIITTPKESIARRMIEFDHITAVGHIKHGPSQLLQLGLGCQGRASLFCEMLLTSRR